MTTEEKYEVYFKYRYLIDNEIQKYSSEKYEVEELYDAGIAGLFKAIENSEEENINIEFKSFALFHIISEMNERISTKN